MHHKSESGSTYGSESPGCDKVKKVKMKCNGCGFISNTELCKCGTGTMHPYKKPF